MFLLAFGAVVDAGEMDVQRLQAAFAQSVFD